MALGGGGTWMISRISLEMDNKGMVTTLRPRKVLWWWWQQQDVRGEAESQKKEDYDDEESFQFKFKYDLLYNYIII